MSERTESLYTLDLSGVAVGLDCRQPALAEGLTRWFGRPSAPVPPTIRLDLEMVPHDDTPLLPHSLLTTKVLAADGRFDIAGGLISGHYDAASRTGSLRAKGILLEGHLMRIFEQVLYQAHVSARQAAGCPGFLVHSAAVIADGRGFLFVGPPEAGKTTVALNSADWHVLGDEMNLVVPGPAGPDGAEVPEVVGTPFNGTFQDKRPGRAPLTGILLLRQAPRHALTAVDRAEAAAALTAEIVPPVGLDQIPDHDTVPAMMDLAAELVDRVPVRRLELLPDPGFWTVLSEHFGLTTVAGAGPTEGN